MKLVIQRDLRSNTAEIYFIEDDGHRRYCIGYNGENLVSQQIDDAKIKEYIPLLKIPYHMLDVMMQQFSDELSKTGYKTENENLIAGKLIATEKHLEDMREISKQMIGKLIER